MERQRHLMLGFCVPVPSLSGRSASLRVLPERAAGWFLKHLIWRILLVIRRPACGVESIFLPGLREERSKPAGLVDEVAQRLCALLGFRFRPRLRDLPERKLACITPAATYPYLQPLLGQRIKTDVIREHWGEIIRLVASLKAGIVAPSSMLRKLAAYRPPEPARPGAARAGADRTHAVHARLARKPRIAPALPCRT